jgi:hypothetical protein
LSWALYNAYGKGPLQAKRVAQVRLNGDEAELQEALRILSMLSKDAMARANPLASLLVERVVLDELSRPDSPAVAALRRAVRDRFGDQVATQAVLQAVESIRRVPDPRQPPMPEEMPLPSRQLSSRTRRQSSAGTSVGDLVSAGLLPEDATIECRLYGVTHAARIRGGRIEMNGQVYDTPSAAAAALRAGKASNGWVIWKFKGELLAEIRARHLVGGEANSDRA